jgi:hypothetical protein
MTLQTLPWGLLKLEIPLVLRRSQDLTVPSFNLPMLYYKPHSAIKPWLDSQLVYLMLSLSGLEGRKKTHRPADATGLTSSEIACRDLLAKENAQEAANRAANHAPESADKEDPGLLPPSTAPLRLEESGRTKRRRGRTMDLVALHTGTARKKGKL